MDKVIQDKYAKTFHASLMMQFNNNLITVRLSESKEKSTWDFTPGDDWLVVKSGTIPNGMEFRYISHTEDRLHYHIHLSGQPDKKLGVSRNGYLGFYQIAEVTDYWKIEPLYLDRDRLFCHLRDQSGNKVKVMNYAPSYWGYEHPPAPLNVKEGEVATFALELSC